MNAPTISQRSPQLIKKLLLLLVLCTVLIGCQGSNKVQGKTYTQGNLKIKNFKEYPLMKLVTSSGKIVKAYIAKSAAEQAQGLSGVRKGQLANHEAMIFTDDRVAPRSFWMPDTYMNLDIFFLDLNLKVTHIVRNIPAHPGMQEPPAIARTPDIMAAHVLELKATSPLSAEIKVGEILKKLK